MGLELVFVDVARRFKSALRQNEFCATPETLGTQLFISKPFLTCCACSFGHYRAPVAGLSASGNTSRFSLGLAASSSGWGSRSGFWHITEHGAGAHL